MFVYIFVRVYLCVHLRLSAFLCWMSHQRGLGSSVMTLECASATDHGRETLQEWSPQAERDTPLPAFHQGHTYMFEAAILPPDKLSTGLK